MPHLRLMHRKNTNSSHISKWRLFAENFNQMLVAWVKANTSPPGTVLPHQPGSSFKCSCTKSMEMEGARTSSIRQAVPGCLYLHVCDEVMESCISLLFPKQFKAYNCSINQGKLILITSYRASFTAGGVISPILRVLIKTSFTTAT